MRQHERQMAHVIGAILAAAAATETPRGTQHPPAAATGDLSPVEQQSRGTAARRDDGTNDERTQR